MLKLVLYWFHSKREYLSLHVSYTIWTNVLRHTLIMNRLDYLIHVRERNLIAATILIFERMASNFIATDRARLFLFQHDNVHVYDARFKQIFLSVLCERT